MIYSILLAPPAEPQLKALIEAAQKRIIKRLKALQCNPRPHGVKKLSGEDGLYRIREGGYRIIYTVQDKELIVLVLKIGRIFFLTDPNGLYSTASCSRQGNLPIQPRCAPAH